MIRLALLELFGLPHALADERLREEFELLACVVCRRPGPAELLVAYCVRRRLRELDGCPLWLLRLADAAVKHARRWSSRSSLLVEAAADGR